MQNDPKKYRNLRENLPYLFTKSTVSFFQKVCLKLCFWAIVFLYFAWA